MGDAALPQQWQTALARDTEQKPAFSDPLPERRLARLLAAYIVAGLFFMVLPGTLLGVWNLVGISSQRELHAIPAAWIQSHGHAQFFGWFGSFVIGISLYTFPKFRGSVCRSVPIAWAMWGAWTSGVGLRWMAGVRGASSADEFQVAAGLEFAAALALLWQLTPSGPKHKSGQAWEIPIFASFAALALLLGWQFWLTLQPLDSGALPAVPGRILISVAIWAFALPLVAGYCAKFFPGLMGAPAASRPGMCLMLGCTAFAAAGCLLQVAMLAAVATLGAAMLAAWSVRVFHPARSNPKTGGVYERYPLFAKVAFAWLAISGALNFAVALPGVLGASRHAFTVGFISTLIFSIGPRILPSFLNSRELWSARIMKLSLWLVTGGCFLRVVSEPLAYSGVVESAWKALPASAALELAAFLLFALNLSMSLATPIPAWFGRKHVNDRMSLYWLVTSYPATRRILVENGLTTLGRAGTIPKSLELRDAAEADNADTACLVERLGDFFESRRPPSLRGKPS